MNSMQEKKLNVEKVIKGERTKCTTTSEFFTFLFDTPKYAYI